MLILFSAAIAAQDTYSNDQVLDTYIRNSHRPLVARGEDDRYLL